MNEERRAARLKEAVLASFHEPAPSVEARLREFGARDWSRAKYWLDVSGLALYFLARIEAMALLACLPRSVISQLQTNLKENRQRTEALLSEAVEITHALRALNIECAVLKGITFPSESVPDPALRNQMDIDLLIRKADLRATEKCLARFGYALAAVGERTWEFKAGPCGTSSLKNLYQERPERALEVHLESQQLQVGRGDRLARSEWRLMQSCWLAALDPADIFVLQGQHLFKHMCSEYTRASWVLEFWRHICGRRNDTGFWGQVESLAMEQPGAAMAVGAAVLLASLIFGQCAPAELAGWSVDKLPAGVCLWIQLYGRRVLISGRPGSKLYLLLRKELNIGADAGRTELRRLLVPLHWPPKITKAGLNESRFERTRRFWIQTRFAARRLHFHVSQGLVFAVESTRWQRRNGGLPQ
ncbi:nucleotidyltransferase family protein [Occallatibacter savannae]|uniref:nucleotidyltransferase family protein n=1 Tax=Occallatibacter savannae TaxID=1002691 RepID=UPI001EF5215B|nr:nucleotidyltransferase family protein [Occallatibacter savannae]